MGKGNAVQYTIWYEDGAIILCPQLQKDFLYALFSTVIELLCVATSCALAAPNEIFSALLVHSICYLITSTGLSLLATFSLYQVPLLNHSCFLPSVRILDLKPPKRRNLIRFAT